MGSKQRQKKKKRTMTVDEIQAQREKEAKRQRDRRSQQQQLNNTSEASSSVPVVDETIEDIMMDARNVEPHTGMIVDANVDVAANPGMFLNPNDYDANQIADLNEAGYKFHTPIRKEIKIENITPPSLKENECNLFTIDSNVLANLNGLVSWRQIRTHANRLYKQFFYNKKLGFQCQLMLQLIKMLKMRKVMKKIGIYAKPKRKDESYKQVVSTVASAIDSIGKTSRSKDKNAARRVITTAIVDKMIVSKRMLSDISGYLNLHHRTLSRAAKRRDTIEIDPLNHCWSFSGRLQRSDMKLNDETKQLIAKFWHDNTRVSSNARDVLKLRVGSKIRDPHPKHLLDMTQTEFFKKFSDESMLMNLQISQRSF